MSRTMSLLAAFVAFAGAPAASGAQSTEPVDFTQVTRPVVEITDGALIDYLLFELIIEPLERPDRMQVIDVTQNGYGPDDVIVVYPSVEAFLIPEFLPDSVQQVMSRWAPEVEFRLDSGNLPSDALAALIGTTRDTVKRAENAIMYDVVQAVERNYRDLPVGILFERDSIGFTFQIWDYNRAAMQFTPRPAYAADSTVSSVLELLKGVGYLPGESGAGLQSGLDRSMGGVASVDRALRGIRSFPNEQIRQLAAKTILLGSYDFDRSGSIDAAREVDALPCNVWVALDGTFPGVLNKFGFTEASAPYLGNIVFSISDRVRIPAGRRGDACITGGTPPPTTAQDVGAPTQTRPLPEPVIEMVSMEAAAEIIQNSGTEPGSADWAAAVRAVLVGHFDTDSSGSLDRRAELDAVPCAVWRAVAATHQGFLVDLGFDQSVAYVGDRIGVDAGLREDARLQILSCNGATEETTPLHVRAPAPQTSASADGVGQTGFEPAKALAGVRAIPREEERQLAARTILRSVFDHDRSGYIDTASELDAIGCDVWTSLELAFPGFARTYGFVIDNAEPRGRYRGSIVFNISARLKEPAARRVLACLNGQTPPPTSAADIRSPGEIIQLPVSLRRFLATETAAHIAGATARIEPGSAGWAAIVRGVLVEKYDFDHSGMLDTPVEVDEIPCIVWNTIQATHGSDLESLGFDDGGQYFGDRIGVAQNQRRLVNQRIMACPK